MPSRVWDDEPEGEDDELDDPSDEDDVESDDEDTDDDTELAEEEDSFPLMCPWCGTPDTLYVDPDQPAGSSYVEDCNRCCRPMRITVTGRRTRRGISVERS
ncbi:MAG: CPXCG motif-containing cysteine-rich protein [Myxococcota bacterium]